MVRLFTTRQLAEYFVPDVKDPMRSANKLARKLVADGMAEKKQTTATIIDVSEPLAVVSCETNVGDIDFNKLVYRNEKRWQAATRVTTTVLTPTNKAISTFGGFKRNIRPNELDHDIGVTELFLQIQRNSPEQADGWTIEDTNNGTTDNEKGRPDAILLGTNQTVIEVVGRRYSADKLQSVVSRFKTDGNTLEFR